MGLIEDVSLTSHNQLLTLCSEPLKTEKPSELPLLQNRVGKISLYEVLYSGIFGNILLKVLYSLFPLILISHLIISVFT